MNKGFRIFSHIFVMVVCAAVIALYFIFPIWRVKATYTVSAEQIKTMLSSSFGDYDLDSALPKEGVDVHISLKINAPVLITAVFSAEGEAVDKLVEDNVESVAEELEVAVGDVTKTITKALIVETIKTEVKDQIKDYLQDYYSDSSGDELNSAAQEIFDELDKDGFIDESADKIVDALYSDDATVDSVSDVAVGIVEDAINKLKVSGNEKLNDITFDDEAETEVRKAIATALSSFANDDGTINISETMQQYLLELLKNLLNDYSEVDVSYSEAAAVSFKVGQNSADTTTETTTEAVTETTSATREEIKNALKEYIEGIIPEDVVPIIQSVLIGVFVIFVISLLCWIYVFIKAIVKLARGEDSVKLKAAIIFGWLPAIIFMFIPSGAYFAISFFPIAIVAGLTLSFFSSGVCAAIAAVMFIIYSIVRRCVTKNNDKE